LSLWLDFAQSKNPGLDLPTNQVQSILPTINLATVISANIVRKTISATLTKSGE
jgi:hypothetical protein